MSAAHEYQSARSDANYAVLRQATNAVLEVFQCLLGSAKLLSPQRKTQQVKVIGFHHATLLFVNNQFEFCWS